MKNKQIIVAIPHSHSWFWTQTCIASLKRNPPVAKGYEVTIVVVDNSPWSPSIRGITETNLGKGVGVVENTKPNKFHASALDFVVEKCRIDYLMAMETDVLVLSPDWLQWFIDQKKDNDYAVGMWHHEEFVNPSCTLYDGRLLRKMMHWCKNHPSPNTLRWGRLFAKSAPLDNNLTPGVLSDPRDLDAAITQFKEWVAGPFSEKRGWPAGTELAVEPTGQKKGPGWYEPGQQLHHWALNEGHTFTVCPTLTTHVGDVPVQSLYGSTMPDPKRQLEAVELFGNAKTAHMWGGTRALDIIKHEVKCPFVKRNTPTWLAREARFWKHIVPEDVQEQTLDLVRKYGWYYTGQGKDHVDDRDRAAEVFVKECYRDGGVIW